MEKINQNSEQSDILQQNVEASNKNMDDIVNLAYLTIPESEYLGGDISHHVNTTMCFKYAHGIVLAVDDRSSPTPLIDAPYDKVVLLNEHTLLAMIGIAADCSFWGRSLLKECRLNKVRYKRRMSMNVCAKFLWNSKKIVPDSKIEAILCGLDINDRQLKIIAVSDEGIQHVEKALFMGQGGEVAQSILDQQYKWDMSYEEALDLATSCIYFCNRDVDLNHTNIHLYHLDREGCKSLDANEISEVLSRLDRHKPATNDKHEEQQPEQPPEQEEEQQ